MAHELYIPISPSHNLLKPNSIIHLFIHPTGMCRIWRFLAVLWSFFHSSLLYTFSCHPSLPTIFRSSLTSSYHPFLGLPLNPVLSYPYIILIFFHSLYMPKPTSGVPTGGGFDHLIPKFWQNWAEFQFHGKYIRNNLIRIKFSPICEVSGTPDYGVTAPRSPFYLPSVLNCIF
jgi:hypothetical protein